jgi:hypothetical protein
MARQPKEETGFTGAFNDASDATFGSLNRGVDKAGRFFWGNRADVSGMDRALGEQQDWQGQLLEAYNARYANAPAFERVQSQEVAAPSMADMTGEQNTMTSGVAGLGQAATAGRTMDRGQSMDLMRQAAMGQAPSAAAIQQQQGLEAAQRAQLSMAARARGGAASLAMRQAGMNTAQLQQQGIGQASMLRAQEMAQARGQYSGAIQDEEALRQQQRAQFAQSALAAYQQRGALDVDRTGLSLRAALANQQANLEAGGLNQKAGLTTQQMAIARDAQMRDDILRAQALRAQAEKDKAEFYYKGVQDQRSAVGSTIKGVGSAVASYATGGLSGMAGGLFGK